MKRNIIKEIIIFLIPILIMAVVVAVVAVNLFPGIQDVFMDGGTYEEIMAYLDSIANVKGLLAIALLQIVQVFSIFIPAAPIQIAAGIVYGFVLSFAVTSTSFVIANMIVYFIAKKRIGRLDELVFSSEGKVQKLFEWINNENPAYMVMLAYMMPGMPNGFVPYVASKADVDAKQFFKVLVIGTAPQIFTMCFISGRLVRGDVALSVIVMILMFVMVVVLYVLKDRIISAKRRIREKRQG